MTNKDFQCNKAPAIETQRSEGRCKTPFKKPCSLKIYLFPNAAEVETVAERFSQKSFCHRLSPAVNARAGGTADLENQAIADQLSAPSTASAHASRSVKLENRQFDDQLVRPSSAIETQHNEGRCKTPFEKPCSLTSFSCPFFLLTQAVLLASAFSNWATMGTIPPRRAVLEACPCEIVLSLRKCLQSRPIRRYTLRLRGLATDVTWRCVS